MKKLAFLLVVIATISSCTKKPKACISASKTTVSTDEVITFTSCSENTDKSEWTFGDNEKATGDVVTHSYDNVGEYTVTLLVEGDKDNDNISTVINVDNAAKYVGTYNASRICNGQIADTSNYNITITEFDKETITINNLFSDGANSNFTATPSGLVVVGFGPYGQYQGEASLSSNNSTLNMLTIFTINQIACTFVCTRQ